VAYGAGLRIS
jgi:integrase